MHNVTPKKGDDKDDIKLLKYFELKVKVSFHIN